MKQLNPHDIQTDGDTAEAYGKEIVEILGLKTKHGFYETTWGKKTPVGLARVLHAILTKPKKL